MTRGRRSVAGLSVVPVLPGGQRPSPPPGLSAPEVEAWDAIVSAMPADWFRGGESVLVRYVAEVVTCAALERRLRAMWQESGPLDRHLLAAHARATAALLRTAAALRLSPRGRYTPRVAAGRLNETKAARARPWEISGHDDDPAA